MWVLHLRKHSVGLFYCPSRKEWRILISISDLTSVHDYTDAFILEGVKNSNLRFIVIY